MSNLILYGNFIVVFITHPGTLNAQRLEKLSTFHSKSEGIYDLEFRRDNQHMISMVYEKFKPALFQFVDISKGKLISSYPTNCKAAHIFSLSSDEKSIAIIGGGFDDGMVWDVPNKKSRFEFKENPKVGEFSATFSPDNKFVATGGFNGKRVCIWDTYTGKLIHHLYSPMGSCRAVSFNSKGTILASGHESGFIILWNVTDGTKKVSLKGHTKEVMALKFRPKENVLVSYASDNTIRIWDTISGKQLAANKLPNSMDLIPVINHDATIIAINKVNDPNTIELWDISKGHRIATLDRLRKPVTAVAFSHDNKVLATASGETITFWSLGTKQSTAKRKIPKLSNPEDKKAYEALQMAWTNLKAQEFDSGKKILLEITKNFSKSKIATLAKQELDALAVFTEAQAALKMNQRVTAKIRLRRILQTYPDTEVASMARKLQDNL